LYHADTKAWSPPKGVQEKVTPVIKMLNEIESILPVSINDIEKISDHLDYDFEKAISYAQNNIHYEPYLGVLRGHDGVATTGKGNAWDQAIFLATIINTMGGDAQIVLGNLSPKDASRLLSISFNPVKQVEEKIDKKKLLKIVRSYDEKVALELEHMIQNQNDEYAKSKLNKDTNVIANSLLLMLNKGGVKLPGRQNSNRLIEQIAKNYAWVRWRKSDGEKWVYLHPVFENQALPNIEPSSFLSNTVPEKYLHQVGLQLFIERQTSAGKFEEIAIMDQFIRPTSELYKKQHSISLVPLDTESKKPTFLVPILNDAIAPGGKAITSLGLTADVADMSHASAKLFVTLSNKMGGALGSLNTLTDESNSSTPKLTGVILKIESIIPNGGMNNLITRRLVDLRNDVSLDLSTASFNTLLDVSIGTEDSIDLAKKIIRNERNFLTSLPLFIAMARGDISLSKAMKTKQFSEIPSPVWSNLTLLSNAFLRDDLLNQISFRPSPLLIARHTFTDPEQGSLTTSDIISNPIVVLNLQDKNTVTINPNVVMLQGVQDTLMESVLVENANGWSQRLPKTLIKHHQDLNDISLEFNWPQTAINIAKKDLDDGYIMAVANEKAPYWWRINPKTGETLGMGKYGGQEITEYGVATLVIGAAVSSYFFRESVKTCGETFARKEMVDCCIVGNLAATYATAGTLGVAGGAGVFKGMWNSAVGSLLTSVGADLYVGKVGGGIVNGGCDAYINNK